MNYQSFKFRPAIESDAELLYMWRNDPETRRQSLAQDAIEWPAHLAWVKNSLSSAKRNLLIAVLNDEPVGTMRLDWDSADVIDLSWTVAPEFRGKGVGAKMLAFCCEQNATTMLRATIKRDNGASIAIAQSCGFIEVKSEKNTDITKWQRPPLVGVDSER